MYTTEPNIMSFIQAKDYPVFVGSESLNDLQAWLDEKKVQYDKVFILVDDITNENCLPRLINEIGQFDEVPVIEIPSGEENKNIDVCMSVWRMLSELGAGRNSLLINLGGGVIGDLGGFVASTYMRGIDYINIPTTLLAQVDASVGGKVGVDLDYLKNQVGAFVNPVAVIVEPIFLRTLNKKQFLSGFAEVIKYGLTLDKKLWKEIKEVKFSSEDLTPIIHRSIEIKNEIVLEDPHEKGIRKTLNFGHTVGHALESFYLNKERTIPLLHGEAVAVGMICECYISYKCSGLSHSKLDKIVNYILSLYKRVRFSQRDFDSLLDIMRHDKKNRNGAINFTLLAEIGKAEINYEVEEQLIIDSLEYYVNRTQI